MFTSIPSQGGPHRPFPRAHTREGAGGRRIRYINRYMSRYDGATSNTKTHDTHLHCCRRAVKRRARAPPADSPISVSSCATRHHLVYSLALTSAPHRARPTLKTARLPPSLSLPPALGPDKHGCRATPRTSRPSAASGPRGYEARGQVPCPGAPLPRRPMLRLQGVCTNSIAQKGAEGDRADLVVAVPSLKGRQT